MRTVENPPETTGPVIDTSGMSEGKARAVEMAEEAREALEHSASFAASLFMGRLRWSRLAAFPVRTEEERVRGDAFIADLRGVLDRADPDRIDVDGCVPDEILEALRGIGAFGIKIPREFGGLGLSQLTYTRAAMLLGGRCANLAALISAHQSIGVPNPLLLFGTDEQKRRFLPALARGELSAFALTEEEAGSDPAKLETRAIPDGDDFIINGTKLWCTGGTHARWIVVMAKTPPARGSTRERITAFIVDAADPGVEVTHQCRFMGHRAIYNAVMQFTDVRVAARDMLGPEGQGLRLALTTLNTGRLTLPAAATGMSRRCLEIARRWGAEREQWGAPVGRHPAVADKIARIASSVFAMESMTLLTSGMVDAKSGDFRVEAAMAKLWCSERAWEVVNETMQIRGGRGYETAASLRDRGERPDPVERFLRDARITTIFEGSSEILRCMAIAREGLDFHAKLGRDVLDARLPWRRRMVAALRTLLFYVPWYASLLAPQTPRGLGGVHPRLRRHVRWAARTSRRLARRLFRRMIRHGMGLERRQLLLGRFVDVATEVFAVTASCSRAQHLLDGGRPADEVLPLVDHLRAVAAERVGARFRGVRRSPDEEGARLAEQTLAERFAWLERE